MATGTAYAVSEGGIESLTKSLAQELAPRRITVICVANAGAMERVSRGRVKQPDPGVDGDRRPSKPCVRAFRPVNRRPV